MLVEVINIMDNIGEIGRQKTPGTRLNLVTIPKSTLRLADLFSPQRADQYRLNQVEFINSY